MKSRQTVTYCGREIATNGLTCGIFALGGMQLCADCMEENAGKSDGAKAARLLSGCGKDGDRAAGPCCGTRIGPRLQDVVLCDGCGATYAKFLEDALPGKRPTCGRFGCSIGADGVCVTCGATRTPRPETHLAACHRRRANYITYMRDRIEDEDWHGVSDAANDLRELDAEIRTLEGASRTGIEAKYPILK